MKLTDYIIRSTALALLEKIGPDAQEAGIEVSENDLAQELNLLHRMVAPNK